MLPNFQCSRTGLYEWSDVTTVLLPHESLHGQLTSRSVAVQTSHFTPTQAGEIFDDVKPRLAVIHHATVNDASREPLLNAVRDTYPKGALVINEDLAVYEITKVCTAACPLNFTSLLFSGAAGSAWHVLSVTWTGGSCDFVSLALL